MVINPKNSSMESSYLGDCNLDRKSPILTKPGDEVEERQPEISCEFGIYRCLVCVCGGGGFCCLMNFTN